MVENKTKKIDIFLLEVLEKTLKEKPNQTIDVIIKTTENPELHISDLQKKDVIIRRMLPSRNSLSVRIKANEIPKLSKQSWVSRIEPVFMVTKQ